jgi:hypothetical protein
MRSSRTSFRILLRGACLAVVALVLTGYEATAKDVPLQSQSKVKRSCQNEGDVSWVKGTGHTYGCMHADGSGIVCSGVTNAQKNSCSTFRTSSFPVPKLPTRDEAIKASDGQP